MKQKLPKSVYTPEFHAQAVKLVLEQGLTIAAASQQLLIPAGTFRDWVQAARAGKLVI